MPGIEGGKQPLTHDAEGVHIRCAAHAPQAQQLRRHVGHGAQRARAAVRLAHLWCGNGQPGQ
jgi:hypothetical protein